MSANGAVVSEWNGQRVSDEDVGGVGCNDVSGNENGRVRAASPVPRPNSEFAPPLFIRTQIFAGRVHARATHTGIRLRFPHSTLYRMRSMTRIFGARKWDNY